MSPEERDRMAGFFEDSLLSDTRICALGVDSWRGRIHVPLHLAGMSAITLGDTIVLAAGTPTTGPRWSRLLFHELVHIVQYRLLGIDEFAARYLGGWARRGFRHSRIPLEQDVRELEARFDASAAQPFSVAAEVARQLSVTLLSPIA